MVAGAAPLALVTGGHRRLGARIAQALALAGYRLALHGSGDTGGDAGPDAELMQALQAGGHDWHSFTANFEQPDRASGLMNEVIAHFGRTPDVLVNSAALFGQDRLGDVHGADLMRHHAINCAAPVLLTQAMAAKAAQEDRRDRCIINILDQRLAHPHGDQLSYTLSKQALAGFTGIAARQLAPHRIRVNAVAPGLTIATSHYDEAHMQRLAAMMPLGCLPQPAQIAEAVLYLVGAKAVTGQVIAVDGGAHMQSYEQDFMHL